MTAGHWVWLNATVPPYERFHLRGVHNYEDRVERCTREATSTWQYGWQAHDAATSASLLDVRRLCWSLRHTRFLMIGDSLSLQLFDSWKARIRSARFVGDDVHVGSRASCGYSCESEPRNALCGGWQTGLCTGGTHHQQSAMYSACDSGAAVYFAQAYRWVIDARAFEVSDGRVAGCASRLHANPLRFGLQTVPIAHLARMLSEMLKPGAHPDRSHVHSSSHAVHRVVVVINQVSSARGIDLGSGTFVP